jgi:hypothetical protein
MASDRRGDCAGLAALVLAPVPPRPTAVSGRVRGRRPRRLIIGGALATPQYVPPTVVYPYPAYGQPPGYYAVPPPAYAPGYPGAGPVYVPPQWVWNGYQWVWQAGYWRY